MTNHTHPDHPDLPVAAADTADLVAAMALDACATAVYEAEPQHVEAVRSAVLGVLEWILSSEGPSAGRLLAEAEATFVQETPGL